MTTTTTHTTRTTLHIYSYTTPSTLYIISVILITIIVLILMYFCINDNTRHVIITGFYYLVLFLIKIILFVPALLTLLYCYIYKAFVFIGIKFKNRSKIDIYIQKNAVINNTDSTTDIYTDTNTDTDTDTITDTINFILSCYTCLSY